MDSISSSPMLHASSAPVANKDAEVAPPPPAPPPFEPTDDSRADREDSPRADKPAVRAARRTSLDDFVLVYWSLVFFVKGRQ